MGDPNLGTWKFNLAKSTFDPGPPPMSGTEVIEAWEIDGVKMTLTLVGADGTRRVGVVHAHYDGKDSTITDFLLADTIAYKRVDADTLAYTVKKDGTLIETGTIVVSKNRGTRTVTATGTECKRSKGERRESFREAVGTPQSVVCSPLTTGHAWSRGKVQNVRAVIMSGAHPVA